MAVVMGGMFTCDDPQRAGCLSNPSSNASSTKLLLSPSGGIRGTFVDRCIYGVASALIYLTKALLFYVGAVLIARGTSWHLLKDCQDRPSDHGSLRTCDAPYGRDERVSGHPGPSHRRRLGVRERVLRIPHEPDIPVLSNPSMKVAEGECMALVYVWSNTFFFAVTDLVMLLRVYAMYHRFRIVLGILLAAYIPSVVVSSLANTIYKPQIEVSALFGATICTLSFNAPSNFSTYFLISYVIISAVLCGFAVVRLVRESLQKHRTVKRWRSNQYLELIVRENVLYFVAYLFAVIVPMVTETGVLQEITSLLLFMFAAIPPVVLSPRLIISVREFHSRVVGDHIDTGFGAISRDPISTNEGGNSTDEDVSVGNSSRGPAARGTLL
ncbi:hypothetical protein BU15DRAFT_84037 [Melanogaster broomeanus]|nr:hypothetical protein BU15DRAFT_84037 [Melanogaster broomeanus]